jgi:glycosyltransferase involved in cell wall biosynthesis
MAGGAEQARSDQRADLLSDPLRRLSEETVVQGVVSVIVPTYKRADMIGRAIESILGQTYPGTEVIVVDDNIPGSPESLATRSTLDEYLESGRVTIIATSGATGGGAARNLAVTHASGEYLAFLDDDDVFLPDKLQTQLAFMIENDVEMSYQDVEWYSGEKLVERRRLDHALDQSKEGLLRAHLRTPLCPTAIFMIRKDAFSRTAGFGEVKTGQDWLLMLRCIEAGVTIGYMPGVHVHQFLHAGDRLSLGKNKIDGEIVRHEIVKSYYDRLPASDITYIEFRHYAVLAVSSQRSGHLARSLGYSVRAFATSPSLCVREGLKVIASRTATDAR